MRYCNKLGGKGNVVTNYFFYWLLLILIMDCGFGLSDLIFQITALMDDSICLTISSMVEVKPKNRNGIVLKQNDSKKEIKIWSE